jgi:hypothetical protein
MYENPASTEEQGWWVFPEQRARIYSPSPSEAEGGWWVFPEQAQAVREHPQEYLQVPSKLEREALLASV